MPSSHQVHHSNSEQNTTELSIPHNALVEYGKEISQVLSDLRAWHNWEEGRQFSPFSFLRKKLLSKRPPCPSIDKLQPLVEFYFPPRGSLKASICDFGDGKFEKNEVAIDHLQHKFGEAKTNWLEKPDWSLVRWVYVLHSANRNLH